jgi:hypothetical protein
MKQYMPVANYQRHKIYLIAFHDSINIDKYFKILKTFIVDENISPNNEDDLQFLRDLLFETKFGRNHIHFYELAYHSMNKCKNNLHVLSRYTEFLGAISNYFLEDMFEFVLKTKDEFFIKRYFSRLSLNNKLKFIKITKSYPYIFKKIPKIGMYSTFH